MKATIKKRSKRMKQWLLHLMLLPGVVLLFIFSYVSMAGIVIAFQKYNPAKGFIFSQKFNGLDNFSYIFSMPILARCFGTPSLWRSPKLFGAWWCPLW